MLAKQAAEQLKLIASLKFIIDENTALNDCFREKKDWRACKSEVGLIRPSRVCSAHIDVFYRWKNSSNVGSGRIMMSGQAQRMLDEVRTDGKGLDDEHRNLERSFLLQCEVICLFVPAISYRNEWAA